MAFKRFVALFTAIAFFAMPVSSFAVSGSAKCGHMETVGAMEHMGHSGDMHDHSDLPEIPLSAGKPGHKCEHHIGKCKHSATHCKTNSKDGVISSCTSASESIAAIASGGLDFLEPERPVSDIGLGFLIEYTVISPTSSRTAESLYRPPIA